MKMDEKFLLDGEFYDEATEKMCAFIPTEREEMKILEFKQFIRRINAHVTDVLNTRLEKIENSDEDAIY